MPILEVSALWNSMVLFERLPLIEKQVGGKFSPTTTGLYGQSAEKFEYLMYACHSTYRGSCQCMKHMEANCYIAVEMVCINIVCKYKSP